MSAKKKGTVQKTTEELEMEEMEGGVDAVVVANEEIQDYQIQDESDVVDDEVEEVVEEEPSSIFSAISAKNYLTSLLSYLRSNVYQNDLTRAAIKFQVPRQRIANGFLAKIFATIADVTGLVIETTRYSLKTLIRVISDFLSTTVDVICNLATSLCRIITFNQTTVQ